MSLLSVGLSTSRWNSRNKSILLMAAFPLLVLAVLYLQIDLLYTLFSSEPLPAMREYKVQSAFKMTAPIVALGLGLWFWYCLRNQDDLISSLFRSHPVARSDNPELYKLVENIAIQLGLETPEIFTIPTTARNAFAGSLADGTNRIYVTEGLMEFLSKDEVEAVLAHEFGHITAHDTRWVGLSIIFTNILGAIPSQFAAHDKFDMPNAKEAEAGMQLFFLSLLLLPVWAGYIIISVMRVFLLHERELDADRAAMEITKNPEALMRALLRINKRARIPYVPREVMLLCIDNPQGGFFATHPRLMYRLRMISRLSGLPIPEVERASMAPVHKRFNPGKWAHRRSTTNKFKE